MLFLVSQQMIAEKKKEKERNDSGIIKIDQESYRQKKKFHAQIITCDSDQYVAHLA